MSWESWQFMFASFRVRLLAARWHYSSIIGCLPCELVGDFRGSVEALQDASGTPSRLLKAPLDTLGGSAARKANKLKQGRILPGLPGTSFRDFFQE